MPGNDPCEDPIEAGRSIVMIPGPHSPRSCSQQKRLNMKIVGAVCTFHSSFASRNLKFIGPLAIRRFSTSLLVVPVQSFEPADLLPASPQIPCLVFCLTTVSLSQRSRARAPPGPANSIHKVTLPNKLPHVVSAFPASNPL